MDIIRSSARWLCAIGLGLTISAWIFVATTSATALNRDTTMQWLDKSGIYSTNLSTLMQVQTTGSGAPVVSQAALDKALSATFTPDYVRQSSETALNGLYDWLDGNTQTIAFTVPVQEKADTFKVNLTNVLATQFEGLPTCASRFGSTTGEPTCIPPGMTAQEMAAQIAEGANSSFLREPLTPQSIENFTSTPNIAWLPQTVQLMRLMVFVLPVVALILAGAFILLSRDKLYGAMQIGRQMVFSSVFLLLAGLIMWYVGSTVDLGTNTETSRDAISAVLTPIVQTIVPGIGGALSLFSGAVAVLGILLWVSAQIIINKRPKAFYMQPQSPPQSAPTNSIEQQSQPPTQILVNPQPTTPPTPQNIGRSGPPKPPIIQ